MDYSLYFLLISILNGRDAMSVNLFTAREKSGLSSQAGGSGMIPAQPAEERRIRMVNEGVP